MTTAAVESETSNTQLGEKISNETAEGVVHTRFGMVPNTPEQQIEFKGGLPGFPGVERYQLERVPNIQGDLMLLQSVDHIDVAFFVLPLDLENEAILTSDIKQACGQAEIDENNLLLLTVVNLQRNGNTLEKYVNLRAPIFVDIEAQTGSQVVLSNPNYPMRLAL